MGTEERRSLYDRIAARNNLVFTSATIPKAKQPLSNDAEQKQAHTRALGLADINDNKTSLTVESGFAFMPSKQINIKRFFAL